MIRIKRNQPAPPALLTAGANELADATGHYDLPIGERDPEHLSSSYFKAYNASGVKPTLNEMFHRKCAYCETKAMPSGYFAIEHFRPKASVKIGRSLQPPGYWWLAAVWDNLVPACNQCNSSHKGNLFPVAGTRATTPDASLSAERRLLVHPCRDDAEVHFEFRSTGEILGKTRKGNESIDVYGLARSDLTEDRKTWIRRAVKLQEDKTRKTVVAHQQGSKTDTQLADEIRALMELRSDEAEYAGAARQITSATVSQIATYLDVSLGTQIDAFVNDHASPIIDEPEPEEDVEDALDELLATLVG